MNIIIKFALFLLCSSCMPELKLELEEHELAIQVIAESDHTFFIKTQESNIKNLRKHIKLVREPREEILNKDFLSTHEIPVLIKALKKDRLFSLQAKKNTLEPGLYYGIYVENNLNYIFKSPQKTPKLISHNIYGDPAKVAKNKIKFLFNFDGIINIKQDNFIEIKSSAKSPQIKSIILSKNKKKIEVNLDTTEKFIEGENYSFVFDEKYNIEAINFIATEEAGLLEEGEPLDLLIGSDGVEFSWQLNNNFSAEIFLNQSLAVSKLVGTRGRVYINLKPDTIYNFIIRAEDEQAQLLLADGEFKSLAPKSLCFSEFLISAPKSLKNKLEFIELVYEGNEEKKYENLSLVIEDKEKGTLKNCVVASAKNPLIVKPKDYVLIVGQEFDEKRANFANNALIRRLPSKNICKGLSHKKPAFIKLVDDKYLVDHYGGYLWEGAKGLSVVRKEPQGLDEEGNYCYSDKARGPSPGAPH